MLEHLTTFELLRRWSREVIWHRAELQLALSDDQVRSGWIGTRPATPAQMIEAEQRVGRALPPSLREFYSISDGWPLTSFGYETIRPIHDLHYLRVSDPDSFTTWADDRPGGYGEILAAAVLLNSGYDQFLLDTRAEPEWGSLTLTSWAPGIENVRPSFYEGLLLQYASFVRFDAPDSDTHQEVDAEVDILYDRLLSGELDVLGELETASAFGNERAALLHSQAEMLQAPHRVGVHLASLAIHLTGDRAFTDDLWPLIITAAMRSRSDHQVRHLEQMIAAPSNPAAGVIKRLCERYSQDGGLRADYGGEFGTALNNIRSLLHAGRPEQAWQAYRTALPTWKPASPLHLAPMCLAWDKDLAQLHTREHADQTLRTKRG